MAQQVYDLSSLAYAITRIGQRFGVGFNPVVLGPGQPLSPVAREQAPRRMQFPIAYNQIWDPRRDIAGIPAFDALRTLNKKHVLASLCVRVRTQQIMAIRGRVVAKNKREQAAEQATCDELNAWFDRPDGITHRPAWMQMLMRDILEIDAPTIYKRPNRGGGLAALEIVDGATIKPILDDRGSVYMYQQVLYGVALSQYLGRRVGIDEELVVGEFAPGELWYQPMFPSTNSPYGRPPMEDLFLLAQVFLQKLNYDLSHFTEGNIPAALGVFDGTTLDVDQVQTFEDHFNAKVQGDVSRGAKIHFVPFPIRVERLSQLSAGGQYENAFEERNVKIVCAHYGVTPSEIGFTDDVNRATADSQENVTYRIGIRPVLEWFKAVLFDPIIQQDFGQRQLEWVWDYGESEDRLMIARIHQGDIAAGVLSPQDSRAMRYPDLEGEAPGKPPAQPAFGAAVTKSAPDDEDEREQFIRRLRALLRDVFGAQSDAVLALLRASTTVDEMREKLIAFWPKETARLISDVLPLFDEIVAAGASSAARTINIVTDWSMANEAALKLAREQAEQWATMATTTSDKQIAQAIADWTETGGTLPDLVKRVKAISARWGDERSDVAAITEVTRIYARANVAVWRESGLVKGYKVETAADELVCPICRPKRGVFRELNDDTELPPFHGRCRCWVVPVVKDADEVVNE